MVRHLIVFESTSVTALKIECILHKTLLSKVSVKSG